MPATPAWPPKSLPRLFLRAPISVGCRIDLEAMHANYLVNVLRLSVGAKLLVFDGRSGEWLATIVESRKKHVVIEVECKTREPETIPDVWLGFAPVKRTRTDWIIEKATELGAARLIPIITRRTIAERVRIDRLENIAIEAAEQCGRTRVPEIAEPRHLKHFLEEMDPSRTLYFADENGGDPLAKSFKQGPAAILIGPEGGFADDERHLISGFKAVPISLGPRILRSETAGLAALAAYMALAGDWR